MPRMLNAARVDRNELEIVDRAACLERPDSIEARA